MKAALLGSLKWTFICTLALFLFHESIWAEANGGSTEKIVLTKNNSTMLHNGQTKQLVQPITIKNNISYVPLSSIAKIYGYQISYDSKAKESIAKNGNLEMRFKLNSTMIKVNGSTITASGNLYTQQGSLMVPMRTWANLTSSTLSVSGSTFILTWDTAPRANFNVMPKEIFATQTEVTYEDQSSAYSGRQIVEERWDGKFEKFDEAGTYVITRWVKDSSGEWSDPYQVTINVLKPKDPPVADFSTDKSVYRMGETIHYTDLSHDVMNSIVRRTWTGNEPVFFEPGEYEVSLEVEDRYGLVGKISKTVFVTDKLLYNQDEYYRLFTPVGDKFSINASSVLEFDTVPYTVLSDRMPLILSNSPEVLMGEEGIAYEDVLNGTFHFNTHNQNGSNRNLNIYLIATNPNEKTASVEVSASGLGGPTTYITTSGKLAAARFLSSSAQLNDKQKVEIPAGESKIILPEISKVPIKPGLTLTTHAEISTDMELRFSVVILDPAKDPIAALPQLPLLERDGKHMRGTFHEASRTFVIDELLGTHAQRVVVGDNNLDPFLIGVDGVTGLQEVNRGNFGVLYNMKVNVAPRTLIALNPRGGEYAGAFMVNGNVVQTTTNSILQNQSQAGVLYRTGDHAETVDISFVIPSGSNLPISVLFLPLPEERR